MLSRGTCTGPNVMYLETGQGSELSSDAHNGWDQVTMEARCYGFAKKFEPFLVNTVVGFIGPEYLYDARQVTRAGLEDHFMGKLSGIPMGCDCCYTNHMKADQNDLKIWPPVVRLLPYISGVLRATLIMYQARAFHDPPREEIFNSAITVWNVAEKMGFYKADHRLRGGRRRVFGRGGLSDGGKAA